jgi:hypothetical protein
MLGLFAAAVELKVSGEHTRKCEIFIVEPIMHKCALDAQDGVGVCVEVKAVLSEQTAGYETLFGVVLTERRVTDREEVQRVLVCAYLAGV